MKSETYVKRYGGTTEMWENAKKKRENPKKVVKNGGSHYCPTCGHTVRQFKKCSYCGQTLER